MTVETKEKRPKIFGPLQPIVESNLTLLPDAKGIRFNASSDVGIDMDISPVFPDPCSLGFEVTFNNDLEEGHFPYKVSSTLSIDSVSANSPVYQVILRPQGRLGGSDLVLRIHKNTDSLLKPFDEKDGVIINTLDYKNAREAFLKDKEEIYSEFLKNYISGNRRY